MAKPGIVVVGASAGGLEALKQMVSDLPADFPAALFIVWHISPEYPSLLPQILDRLALLPVSHATDGEKIEPGRIYVAPPDHHMVLDGELIRVTRGPRENRFRPSVDVLFRSAARSYGSSVIGVVLSGSLDDGAAGLVAIKARGGTAIVQDPFEALYPSMPMKAMGAVGEEGIDHTVSVADLGQLLSRLVKEPVGMTRNDPVTDQLETEVQIALEGNALKLGSLKLGEFSPYTCPECHGVLVQIDEGHLFRFRCHTGHAYSLDTLLAEVTRSVEDALWNALRTIEESELLINYLADHLDEAHNGEAAALCRQKGKEAKERARLVRQAVRSHELLTEEKLCDSTKK